MIPHIPREVFDLPALIWMFLSLVSLYYGVRACEGIHHTLSDIRKALEDLRDARGS